MPRAGPGPGSGTATKAPGIPPNDMNYTGVTYPHLWITLWMDRLGDHIVGRQTPGVRPRICGAVTDENVAGSR